VPESNGSNSKRWKSCRTDEDHVFVSSDYYMLCVSDIQINGANNGHVRAQRITRLKKATNPTVESEFMTERLAESN